MTQRLVKMAASIDASPTLEQVDAMLSELATQDRSDEATQKVENGLLDLRSLLTSLAFAEGDSASAAVRAPAPRFAETGHAPDRADSRRSGA